MRCTGLNRSVLCCVVQHAVATVLPFMTFVCSLCYAVMPFFVKGHPYEMETMCTIDLP